MAEKLMTIKEVADYLRVSRTRLYQLARAGEVPAKRVGHLWRFDKAEIDSWLGQGACMAASGTSTPP